jgi:putative transcriptional regulator
MLSEISDTAILGNLGKRLLQYRLNKNMTQTELAKEAGVSSRTVNRVEHGNSTQLSNFIRLLRSLDLSQNLDALIPEPAISPIQQMKLGGKARKRASSSAKTEGKTWSWGDDE